MINICNNLAFLIGDQVVLDGPDIFALKSLLTPSYNVDCPWSSTVRRPHALTVVVTIRGTVGLGYSC